MNTILAVILAYLIGSVSFAVVVSKLFGLSDPRTYGSKNPGATNVLRSGNKAAAILTLLGDAVKGWFAVWLAIKYHTSISNREPVQEKDDKYRQFAEDCRISIR